MGLTFYNRSGVPLVLDIHGRKGIVFKKWGHLANVGLDDGGEFHEPYQPRDVWIKMGTQARLIRTDSKITPEEGFTTCISIFMGKDPSGNDVPYRVLGKFEEIEANKAVFPVQEYDDISRGHDKDTFQAKFTEVKVVEKVVYVELPEKITKIRDMSAALKAVAQKVMAFDTFQAAHTHKVDFNTHQIMKLAEHCGIEVTHTKGKTTEMYLKEADEKNVMDILKENWESYTAYQSAQGETSSQGEKATVGGKRKERD